MRDSKPSSTGNKPHGLWLHLYGACVCNTSEPMSNPYPSTYPGLDSCESVSWLWLWLPPAPRTGDGSRFIGTGPLGRGSVCDCDCACGVERARVRRGIGTYSVPERMWFGDNDCD